MEVHLVSQTEARTREEQNVRLLPRDRDSCFKRTLGGRSPCSEADPSVHAWPKGVQGLREEEWAWARDPKEAWARPSR